MSNTPILLPQNPAEGEIFNVTAHRKLIYTEGRWKLHTNNLVFTDDASFALNPLISNVEPALTVPERFWYKPSTGSMYLRTVAGWVEVTDNQVAVEAAGGAVNLALGDLFTLTVSGPTILTIQNPKPAPYVSSFILEVTNGAAGAITWFNGVRWDKGVPPTLTAGVDILGFYSRDGGTTWRGFVMASDSKQGA